MGGVWQNEGDVGGDETYFRPLLMNEAGCILPRWILGKWDRSLRLGLLDGLVCRVISTANGEMNE